MIPNPTRPYAKVPTLFEKVHNELSAIQEITNVLGLLPDHETRARVIQWISERFTENPMQPSDAEGSPDQRPLGVTLPDADALLVPQAEDLFGPTRKTGGPVNPRVTAPPAATDRAAEVAAPYVPPLEFVQPVERVRLVKPVYIVESRPPDSLEQHVPFEAVVAIESVVEHVTPRVEPSAIAVEDRRVSQPLFDEARLELRPLRLARVEAALPELMTTPAAPREVTPIEPAPRAEIAMPDIAPAPDLPPPAPMPSAAVPSESMETMLRSLVDDFRQLAGEWENT